MEHNSIERYKKIKRHFENGAKKFDKRFFKIVPFYQEIMDVLISAIPFKENKKIKVIDLGCGTGNITKALKERYPKAEVMCIDLAKNMIELAKAKLRKYNDIEYWCGDIRKFDYNKKYDAIISSLVLHHVDKKEKRRFYRKVFNTLEKGGVFYSADLILASNKHLEGMYLGKWKAFMRRHFSLFQINKMLKHKDDEDRPIKLTTEIKLLTDIGFKDVDVIWKYYNFTVYGGKR